jgi:hypothetical protein
LKIILRVCPYFILLLFQVNENPPTPTSPPAGFYNTTAWSLRHAQTPKAKCAAFCYAPRYYPYKDFLQKVEFAPRANSVAQRAALSHAAAYRKAVFTLRLAPIKVIGIRDCQPLKL